MKPEIVTLWTAALRSDKYTQGKGRLTRFGHFCCLGVLCELAADANIVQRITLSNNTNGYRGDTDAVTATHSLPRSVMEWAGMDSVAGKLPETETETMFLWELNDIRGYPFAHIADIIEANQEKL